MSRYTLDDGRIVDTKLATQSWNEQRDWDGHNHIGRSSGTQWDHQTLHRSKKGRFYVEHTSQWEGRMDHVSTLPDSGAAHWLLANDYELPDDLKHLEAELLE